MHMADNHACPFAVAQSQLFISCPDSIAEEGYTYWIKYTHCLSQIEVGFECCLAKKENEFYSFCEDCDFLE